MQEGELLLLEFLKPILPTDLLQRSLAGLTGEIDPDDARVVVALGANDRGGFAFAFLHPLADLVVIGCYLSAVIGAAALG